jgi:hypothetical protein
VAAFKDPIRDALVRELHTFRKGPGQPTMARLEGLSQLVDALGQGQPERAFEALRRYQLEVGADPESDIGAFYYLSGWGVGLDTVDARRTRYAGDFHCDISTAWRRAERGIRQLVIYIRDHDENSRPWALISLFQSGNAFQPFLDFNLGYETWRPPVVTLNREVIPIDFHVHHNPDDDTRYTRRIVLPETPLKLDVDYGEPMARLRVAWAMPVWPLWQVGSWTADPRIVTMLRTYRERAVEVSLQWWKKTPAADVEGLVHDAAIWADRSDPNRFNLPSGWRIG